MTALLRSASGNASTPTHIVTCGFRLPTPKPRGCWGERKHSWLWLQPHGQLDISPIEAPRKVISYITKEIYKPDSQDQLFLYQAPLLNSCT
jgi:hypothetical protein